MLPSFSVVAYHSENKTISFGTSDICASIEKEFHLDIWTLQSQEQCSKHVNKHSLHEWRKIMTGNLRNDADLNSAR